MNDWRPVGATAQGAPLGTLSRSLASFEAMKSKISVVTGLNMVTASGDPHLTGMTGLWTGSKATPDSELVKTAPENGALADGISIDQAVAQAFAGTTRFNSIKFHAAATTSNGLGPGWLTNSYAGPGRPIFGESNPFTLFDSLFEGLEGIDQNTVGQIRAERRSVLDLVTSDIQRASSLLGESDRYRLELHLEHLRSIESRLSSDVELSAACDSGPFVGQRDDAFMALVNNNYPRLVRLHTDLALLALRCDLTRVVNLQFGTSVAGQVYNWFNYTPPQDTRGDTGHHGHSHDWNLTTVSSNYLRDIDRWYAEQIAYLVTELDAMDDGEGTMLDNSLLVWGNEIARGDHSHIDHPFLVAGGASGFLKMGRNYDFRGTGLEHHRLLVSMGNAMGLSLNTFGTLDESSGGLVALET
jgi:hypothetical protein